MKDQYKKNILVYLGKFPGYGFDIDGGSILARQLVDILKHNCNLDLVFIRKRHEIYEDNAVNDIRYVEYKDAFNNKFIRRLENLDTNVEALGNYTKYDVIIAAHVSKFFGFHKMPQNFWDRTILFPMFCTSSYKRAGEKVPYEYTQQEQFVFDHVNRVICPSTIEKLDLLRDYKIDEGKIIVIPRGINPIFCSASQHQLNQQINIVCVGSIKKQKNNLDAVKILSLIRSHGIAADLHLVCTIQDKSLYDEIQSYIDCNNLKNHVHFHIELSQAEVAELMKNMDINISVSNWETFGRGIFEGIASGLPTFVYSRLTGIKDICQDCEGVTYSKNAEEMANNIITTISSRDIYDRKVNSLSNIANKVSYKNEQKNLLTAILQQH